MSLSQRAVRPRLMPFWKLNARAIASPLKEIAASLHGAEPAPLKRKTASLRWRREASSQAETELFYCCGDVGFVVSGGGRAVSGGSVPVSERGVDINGSDCVLEELSEP